MCTHVCAHVNVCKCSTCVQKPEVSLSCPSLGTIHLRPLRQNLPLEPKNFPLDYLFNESRGFLSFSLPSPGLRSTYHHTQLMWY